MQAIVVGGGIMGLCAAWGLSRQGHRVTVLEQSEIPNPMGSSGDAHRLIRHPYGAYAGYARMIDPAFRAWDLLWADLGQSFYHPTSTLVLAQGELDWAETSLADMEALGFQPKRLSPAQMKSLAPALRSDSIDLAWHMDTGGALLAQDITAALAQRLQATGITLATQTSVAAVDPERGAVVLDDGTRLSGDLVVVAAGPWVGQLLPHLAPRLVPSRQVVLYLRSPTHLHPAWEQSPMVLDIHAQGGIYVVPPVAGTGLKVGDHSFSMTGDPDANRTATTEEIDALFAACAHRFVDHDAYQIEQAKTCFYTVCDEERFAIERLERCIFMSGFSGHGFKFGALMGLLVSHAANGFLSADVLADLAAGRIADADRIQEITSPCLG